MPARHISHLRETACLTPKSGGSGQHMARMVKAIIRFYQRMGRGIFPPACRFHPSCSQYALEAVERYGAWRGGAKAILRLCRCSPLSSGGYDPLK